MTVANCAMVLLLPDHPMRGWEGIERKRLAAMLREPDHPMRGWELTAEARSEAEYEGQITP